MISDCFIHNWSIVKLISSLNKSKYTSFFPICHFKMNQEQKDSWPSHLPSTPFTHPSLSFSHTLSTETTAITQKSTKTTHPPHKLTSTNKVPQHPVPCPRYLNSFLYSARETERQGERESKRPSPVITLLMPSFPYLLWPLRLALQGHPENSGTRRKRRARAPGRSAPEIAPRGWRSAEGIRPRRQWRASERSTFAPRGPPHRPRDWEVLRRRRVMLGLQRVGRAGVLERKGFELWISWFRLFFFFLIWFMACWWTSEESGYLVLR